MAVIPCNEADVSLLAKLMRAGAEGEEKLGMLMVGNTGVNRVRGDCSDFTDVTSIRDMVYQIPGGFEATRKGYFHRRTRETDRRLGQKAIKGCCYHPAMNSL